MTDGEALYRAVLESPDDDAPRLVWADWLEENGDPERAEFVRLQCRWAILEPGDPTRDEMCERWMGLLESRRRQWTSRIGPPEDCGFWRGLPDWFDVLTDDCMERITHLRQHVPAQCIKLRLGRFRKELSDWPGLDSLRDVWLCERVPDPFYPQTSARGWVWFIQSPGLRKLRAFRAVLDVSSAGVISAISGTDWPNLRELTLSVSHSDPEHPAGAWSDLPDAAWFRDLQSLDLRDCGLTDDVVHRLLTRRGSLALTYLDLRGNALTDRGVRRLVQARVMPNLRQVRTSARRARGRVLETRITE